MSILSLFYCTLIMLWIILQYLNFHAVYVNCAGWQDRRFILLMLSLVRGLFSLLASLCASMGYKEFVLVFGTLAISAVITEFVAEKILSSPSTHLRHQFFKHIKLALCIALFYFLFHKIIALTFHSNTINFMTLLLALIGITVYLRLHNGQKLQAKWLSGFATSRGLMGAFATAYAYYPTGPVSLLIFVGHVILVVSFIELLAHIFRNKWQTQDARIEKVQ